MWKTQDHVNLCNSYVKIYISYVVIFIHNSQSHVNMWNSHERKQISQDFVCNVLFFTCGNSNPHVKKNRQVKLITSKKNIQLMSVVVSLFPHVLLFTCLSSFTRDIFLGSGLQFGA